MKNSMCKRDLDKIKAAMPIIADCTGLMMIYLSQFPEKHKAVGDALAVFEKFGLDYLVRPKGKKAGRPRKGSE